MIILLCPTCYSAKVKKKENKSGGDNFKCKSCGETFPLIHASYQEEGDLFD